MDTASIVVREARRGDAPLIASVVCMAVGYDVSHPIYPVFLSLARRKHTQYSYLNALVAEVDGVAAGAIVGYNGACLAELREPIYALLKERLGSVPEIEDETESGEFYLDSVGVLPQFRGCGVGRALINSCCERAFSRGHRCVGLIVDYDNPRAEKLYTTLGFGRVGTRLFLGHQMWHLQRIDSMDIRERVLRSDAITPFQRRVYMALLDVPAGSTITYGELARHIGCGSAQAVGQALKRNPFAPQVPCHRVVAADGSLGGYNGARTGEQLERKRRLLEEENLF